MKFENRNSYQTVPLILVLNVINISVDGTDGTKFEVCTSHWAWWVKKILNSKIIFYRIVPCERPSLFPTFIPIDNN